MDIFYPTSLEFKTANKSTPELNPLAFLIFIPYGFVGISLEIHRNKFCSGSPFSYSLSIRRLIATDKYGGQLFIRISNVTQRNSLPYWRFYRVHKMRNYKPQWKVVSSTTASRISSSDPASRIRNVFIRVFVRSPWHRIASVCKFRMYSSCFETYSPNVTAISLGSEIYWLSYW